MITIRHVKEDDLELILELNSMQKDFKLSDTEHVLIERLAFDERGKPLAYGVVKKMAEAIMLVNYEVSKLKRAEAMRELMKYAEMGAKRAGCKQLHCFVAEASLAQSLERHFGFTRSRDTVMVKDL